MPNYMKKTKRELVAMLKTLKAENDDLKSTKDNCLLGDKERVATDDLVLEYEKLKALYDVKDEEAEKLKTKLYEAEKRITDVTGPAMENNDKIKELSEKLKQTDARLMEAEKVLNNQSETLGAMKRYYELFTCLMEDCTDKYVFLDASYDIRYINQNARDYLGVSDNGPLIGKSFFDFIREKDAPAVKKALSKALFKGDSEKIKTTAHVTSSKKLLKLKVKMSRIQCYQEPSVMLILK